MESPEQVPQAPVPSAWDADFQRLRERFVGIKDSILFCVHAMQQNPDIALDDLKPRAELHGLRVTAASWNAALRLLAPPREVRLVVDAPLATEAEPELEPKPVTPPPRVMPVRKPQQAPAPASPPHGSVENMLLQVIDTLRAEEGERTERLRAAVREALDVIRDALAD